MPERPMPAKLRQNMVVRVPIASTSPFITASMPEKSAIPTTPTKNATIGSWRGGFTRPRRA